MMPKYSIVVPIHNEGGNIDIFMRRFWDELTDDLKKNIEILLIENGSTDNSYEVCRNLAAQFPNIMHVEKIDFPSYGEAIKCGIMNSKGEVTCILECDALDTKFLALALNIIDNNKSDFVLASKRHPQSIDLRPLKRRLLTLLFNALLKIFFNFPGTDTHGLKAIKTDIAKALCEIMITKNEIVQTEMVLLAYKMGYRVQEVPIKLKEIRQSSISIFRRLPKVIGVVWDLKKSLNRFQ